jgi:hypothetical protein
MAGSRPGPERWPRCDPAFVAAELVELKEADAEAEAEPDAVCAAV